MEALEYFVKLHDDGIIPKSVFLGTEDPSALFKAGQLATVVQGSWKIYIENITDFEWGVTYMPMQETRASRLGGNFFGVIKGSGKEELAKGFLTWFYQEEQYKTYCETGNYMSAVNTVTPDYANHPEMYEIFTQELEATGTSGSGDSVWDYAEYVGNGLLDAVSYALNAKAALDAFAQDVSDSMSIPLA